VDLHRPPSWHPLQSTSRKRRTSGGLARGLRSLMIDTSHELEPPSPYLVHRQPSPSRTSEKREITPPPSQKGSTSSLELGWDLVDDLPLRWATDYVPLAVPGSRLMNASVSTFALWRDDEQSRGSALLAVAIKSAVLLYESPKGERAFRFVKVSHLASQQGSIDSP
jgi:hypothetical protein